MSYDQVQIWCFFFKFTAMWNGKKLLIHFETLYTNKDAKYVTKANHNNDLIIISVI